MCRMTRIKACCVRQTMTRLSSPRRGDQGRDSTLSAPQKVQTKCHGIYIKGGAWSRGWLDDECTKCLESDVGVLGGAWEHLSESQTIHGTGIVAYHHFPHQHDPHVSDYSSPMDGLGMDETSSDVDSCFWHVLA